MVAHKKPDRRSSNAAAPDRRLELLRGRRVQITTRQSEARQVDGDLIDDGRGFTAEVEPGALVVRVPHDSAGATPAGGPAHSQEPKR